MSLIFRPVRCFVLSPSLPSLCWWCLLSCLCIFLPSSEGPSHAARQPGSSKTEMMAAAESCIYPSPRRTPLARQCRTMKWIFKNTLPYMRCHFKVIRQAAGAASWGQRCCSFSFSSSFGSSPICRLQFQLLVYAVLPDSGVHGPRQGLPGRAPVSQAAFCLLLHAGAVAASLVWASNLHLADRGQTGGWEGVWGCWLVYVFANRFVCACQIQTFAYFARFSGTINRHQQRWQKIIIFCANEWRATAQLGQKTGQTYLKWNVNQAIILLSKW